jgi:hypothetical protein
MSSAQSGQFPGWSAFHNDVRSPSLVVGDGLGVGVGVLG